MYKNFIMESNAIEGIHTPVTEKDIEVFTTLMQTYYPTVDDVTAFVKHFQPNAVLRDKRGLDVRVGSYYPPNGGPKIVEALQDFLYEIGHGLKSPYENHQTFEHLHPFTDCNGRLGRALWAWDMQECGLSFVRLGFLHNWYYQSLK